MSHDTALEVYRGALPVVLVSLVAGLFAGTILGSETMRAGIESVPGLLLLLPAFLATRGGVYGSLGARLSSGLHQGVIEPRFEYDERLANAVVASFVNGMAVSAFIACVAFLVLAFSGGGGSLLQLLGIMLVAGFLSALLMLSVLVSVVLVGYRRGYDPDNVVGPLVTTLGDVFGVFFLLVGVVVVGWFV
ncbi:magnesium transporter [Halalkalicoccus sp. NIPERK01]|uniref:magnesium transporter n=1 Tax=Halalkalicoccus sp. NIPERK01 TaxID=3053469 RepID=UPI00256EF910|nr:magnesium transporter [Halalkalicoccus sp. NIPERK01]MDL5362910.1 magnesium transporter [Halalkalicoccus sp. NIPERK01]